MIVARVVLSVVLSLAAAAAHAQSYPSKPIRLVAPFPAGGPTDTTARVAARALQARLGQTVVVENQGGAGGTIGARAVANPSLPVTSAGELVAYAKANPGKLNYGAAIGIGPHFLMELFKIRTGANMVHVPYRGSGPIIADVIGGQIQLTMSGKSVLLPHVQSGKMRAIAVTAGERWPELPDVGTLVEAKYMDAAYDTIFGIVAPAGTPAPVIATLNAAMNDGLKSDEVRTSLAKLGIEPRASTVAEFAAIIATEAPRWAEVVRVTGIKAGE